MYQPIQHVYTFVFGFVCVKCNWVLAILSIKQNKVLTSGFVQLQLIEEPASELLARAIF